MKTVAHVRSIARRLKGRSVQSDAVRHVWHIHDVVDENLPATIQRTYIEHKMLRSILGELEQHWKCAADIGCGFGRNIPILQEFADKVVGFEREPQFRTIAQSLHPDAVIRNYPLSPLDDSTRFSFSMCFTFLQHLFEPDAQNILSAAKQFTEGGYMLLVEDTQGPVLSYDPLKRGDRIYIPRPVETYQTWMMPFKLIKVWPRPIEATFSCPGWAGAFMLFVDRS